MMTIAGNGPAPSGLIRVAGISNDEPTGVTVSDDSVAAEPSGLDRARHNPKNSKILLSIIVRGS
jgi:hypothetical protein